MVVHKSAPRTRKVVISRHSHIGYGFVAGSEKPVLIRSVAEGISFSHLKRLICFNILFIHGSFHHTRTIVTEANNVS